MAPAASTVVRWCHEEDAMPVTVFAILLTVVVLVVIVGVVLMRRRSSSDTMFTPLDSSAPNTITPPVSTSNVVTPGPSDMTATDFRLTIQDVFTIKGRGTVVTGR